MSSHIIKRRLSLALLVSATVLALGCSADETQPMIVMLNSVQHPSINMRNLSISIWTLKQVQSDDPANAFFM